MIARAVRGLIPRSVYARFAQTNRYHAICLWHGDLGERTKLRRVRALARQHRQGTGLAPACRHAIGILHVTRDTFEGVTSHVLERV